MNHQAIYNPIVWDALPNFDPKARHMPLTICVPGLFWERAQRRAAQQPAAWDAWLSKLAADVVRAGLDGNGNEPADMSPAAEAIRSAAADALGRAAVMAAGAPAAPGQPSRPVLQLLSDAGAVLVVRMTGRTEGRLEDAYFPRAALHPTSAPHSPADSRPNASPSDLDPEPETEHDAERRLAGARAVARQFVARHAAIDAAATSLRAASAHEGKRSTTDADPGASSPARQVRFMSPAAWGLEPADEGYRWCASVQSQDRLRGRLAAAGARQVSGGKAGKQPGGKTSELGAAETRRAIAVPAMDARLARPRISDESRTEEKNCRGTAAACADPLDCLGELAEAAAMAEVRPPRGRRAAYALAAALGRCRAFGAIPPVDFTLAPGVAARAAAELRDRLEQWTAEARDLPAILDDAGAFQEEDICLGLVEARMEAWAAIQAIDEAYAAAFGAGEPEAAALGDAIDGALDAAERFDEALRENPAPLAIAAGTCLLSNWRALLAPEHRELPPWWLQA